MLENLNTETIVAATTGTVAGGSAITWVVQFLVKRIVEQNDRKHELSAKAIEKLADAQSKAYKAITHEISKLQVDSEVIKARIGECMSLRDAVTENTKDIAIAMERVKNNRDDIDDGFQSFRTRMSDIMKTINQLKPINGGK